MTSSIGITNLKKFFGNSEVFKDLTLTLEVGKITVLFGPNGSGKSTLLNIISGITPQDGGEVCIENFQPSDLSYVFQNYRESLLPWRTNFENITLPLEIQNKSKKYAEEKVATLQKVFQFSGDWNGYPYQLSGGQQQVLAFMCALITEPKLLLIDEPFSALDYENNLQLRKYLQDYFLLFTPTVVLVTHNIEEAVHLADTIIIFSKKPTQVIEVIHNPLSYPRNMLTLKSEQFHHIKDNVLDAFQKALTTL